MVFLRTGPVAAVTVCVIPFFARTALFVLDSGTKEECIVGVDRGGCEELFIFLLAILASVVTTIDSFIDDASTFHGMIEEKRVRLLLWECVTNR